MTTLHVVNHPDALESCLQLAAVDDIVLLIEDAAVAFALCAETRNSERALVFLEEHLPPGTPPAQLPTGTTSTDFEGFVRLVARCRPIVTWS